MNIIIVFVLIVGILAILFYINYKRDNEAALIATAIIIMQSVCFLLVNLGILRCSVYEVPLLKENTIYSICQLLLLVIALDSKGIVLHQFMKFCKIQKKIKIYWHYKEGVLIYHCCENKEEYPLSPQHIYVTRVNIPSFDGLLTGVPLSVEYADGFLSAFFLRKYDGGALQLAT